MHGQKPHAFLGKNHTYAARGVASGGNASTSLSGAPRAATACEQRARGGSVPAQSSRSIGFLMLLGSSLTLCGLICNNNAMLSPSLLRYDPSKSNFRLLVTIVPFVLFAFLQTNPLKSRQSLSCLCGTAEAPLGMPEATPTTHQALRGRIQTYFYGLPTLCEYLVYMRSTRLFISEIFLVIPISNIK